MPVPLPRVFVFLFLFAFSRPCVAGLEIPDLPEVKTYDQLVHAIREARAASQIRVEAAVDQEKVREAWETGKLIDTHVLQHKERANYDEQVLAKLAEDLETSESELYRMLKFARAYPILAAPPQLTWSHYRELLSIDDPDQRKRIEEEAVKENWGHKRLRREVSRLRQGKETSTEILKAIPGKAATYRVVKARVGPYEGGLALDLGFSNYFQPDKINKFKEGDIVTLEKGKPKKMKAGEEVLFTYNAYVTEIIDGDTFKAVIDLGFKIVTEQKLRLRGLDAPEIESTEGKEAREFVVKAFAKAGNRVLIKTIKSDKYDRYLADVFIPSPSNGYIYLNQKLIDEGLAVRVSE